MSLLDEAEAELGFAPTAQPKSLLEEVESEYGLADAEPAAPAEEDDPSYASRLGTAAGLGVKNLGLGVAHGVTQTAATPVAVAAGTADATANIARMTGPMGISPQAILTGAQAAMAQPGSLLERAQAGADAILGMLKPQPISGAIQAVAPGAMEFGLPGAQAYADETRAAIQSTNQQLEANKEDVGGDLLLDATTGLAQMAPAVGVGLATRNPAAAAASLAAPMYGQTLAEGEGDVARRAGRAAAFTGAEFVTELPVAKLLTVPLKAIVKETGQSGLKTALGRIGATAGKEFTQEAQTSVLQDLYDRGALDEDKSLGDMLADAGYAGLVGGIAGGVAGAPAAVATARQDSKATADAGKARAAYEATFKETDDGQGGTTFVDGAGNPVGDTLDEARATAARLTPEEVAGRIAKVQPAPAAAPETPAAPAQPEPAPSPMQRGTPRVEPASAAPEQQPQATQTEEAPDAGDTAADIPAGRPGGTTELPDRSVGEQRPEEVGNGADLGRVPTERDVESGTVGEVEGSRAEAPVVDPGRQPDAALTEEAAAEPQPVVKKERPQNTGRFAYNAKPPYEMTQAELLARKEAVEKDIADTEARILGDKADAYRKALRRAMSENDKTSERGYRELDELGITPEQTVELEGDDTYLPDDAWDDGQDYIDATTIAGLAETPAQAADGMWRDLLAVGRAPKTDPSMWSRREKVGYAGLRALQERIREKGWDAKAIQNQAIQRLRGQIEDNDVEFMLERFLKPEASQPAPQSPMLRGKPRQPKAAITQEQRNDEVQAQQGKPDVAGAGEGQVRGEQAQAQEEIKPAEPAAEFTSDTGAAPDAAVAPSDAWKGKKGAARLQALVAKSEDVPADAYEDARLPGYMGEAVDAMARLFKKDVVVFRAKEGTAYAPGGLLFPADPSTIYLNADANVAPAVVFMHEMVHSMKRTDPATYAALEKAVAKLLRNKDEYVAKRLRGKKLSADLVTEEMIADVMADHASTPQFWSDLYERFDDKNAWSKFVDYVRSLMSNVIDTLYPIGANNYISDFNAAYQAVVDAAYNHARAQHGDVASDGQAMEMPAGSQTDTPEFKRWFGDSKVVDAEGKPLVVYHGTAHRNFEAFRPGRAGAVYFTPDTEYAADYGNTMMPAYLRIKKLADLTDPTSDAYKLAVETFNEAGGWAAGGDGRNETDAMMDRQSPLFDPAQDLTWEVFDNPDADVAWALRKAGYDGVKLQERLGIDSYAVFNPEQIKSAIGNRGTFDPNSPNILESAMLSATPQQGSPPSQSLLDEGNAYWRAGAMMWDNLNRMRILQEKAVERGLKLKDEMNVWVRENLSRSKMRVMADDVTQKFQEPILKTMKQAGLTLKQVDDYLMALHAPERNAKVASINPKFKDGGSGMTNAEAAATLAAFTPEQTKALQAIEAKVQALQEYKLGVMEKYGLMEPDDIARLKSMYQHYVPLKTIEEEQTLPGATGRGLDIRGAEVKAALGRGSRATSPLMVSFQDMARTLVRAHKNEAGNALLELTRDPVLASMRTPQGKPIISIAVPSDFAIPMKRQVYDLYDPSGTFVKRYTRLEKANEAGSKTKGYTIRTEEEVTTDVPGNWWQNEEVFVTKENGVPQYIHVRDPELMAQLRRMGDAEMGPAIRAIGQGTRLFARMLTQYNPVFAPVNIIRDAIQASILSLGVPGLNPVKVMAGILPNLGRIMAHKLKPNARYQEFLEDGGSTNAYGLNDLNDALADVQALGISLGYHTPSKGKWDAAWKAINAKRNALKRTAPVKSVFGTLTWWNEAFENAVRLSTYNAMRDAGISRDQAAFQSKELSTNFNKKGTLSSALNAVYVFVNAAMQGNRALVRFWKESGKVKTAFAGLVFAGVLQDLLGAMFGGEDDDSGLKNIDEVGDWALDHNIVLPTGENNQFKIPLAYGINLPFVLGRRISKAIRTGDGLSQMAGILNVMADNFSPIGGFEPVKEQKTGDLDVSATLFKTVMPSLARPGFSVVVNSNFMGAPIAREPFQGDKSPAPRAYDFKPGTADYAVKLSKLMNEWSGGNKARPGDINVSPEHIQYLVGEYSGGAGRFVSDVTDMTSKAVKGKSEDIDFSKAPFVRSFFGTDSRSDAYSRYREISTRVAYLKDEKKAGVPTDPKYRAIARTVEQAEDKLKDLRKIRKAAYAKDDMAKVREIQDKETAIIKGVVKRFNDQQGK